MKFVRCVGAINTHEVEGIFVTHSSKTRCLLLITSLINDYSDIIPFGDDPTVMKEIKEEISSGPFKYIVIFYEDQ